MADVIAIREYETDEIIEVELVSAEDCACEEDGTTACSECLPNWLEIGTVVSHSPALPVT